LAELDSLRLVFLLDTPVTAAGVASLKKAKPDLRTNPPNP
jgi:hypothetical protein